MAATRNASSAVFAAGARFVPRDQARRIRPQREQTVDGIGMLLEGLLGGAQPALAVVGRVSHAAWKEAAIRRISAVAASACAGEGACSGPHPESATDSRYPDLRVVYVRAFGRIRRQLRGLEEGHAAAPAEPPAPPVPAHPRAARPATPPPRVPPAPALPPHRQLRQSRRAACSTAAPRRTSSPAAPRRRPYRRCLPSRPNRPRRRLSGCSSWAPALPPPPPPVPPRCSAAAMGEQQQLPGTRRDDEEGWVYASWS